MSPETAEGPQPFRENGWPAQTGQSAVPNGTNLHVGSKGQAVVALRRRLEVTADLDQAAGISPVFDAYVGHKEACSRLPEAAVLLAHSPACPVQMFRLGRNMYATQFHPELDLPGLLARIAVYDRHGYYPAEGQADLIAHLEATTVDHPPKILRNFIARYARD